jgi:4'-phosphopantetheinyl transferase
LKKETLKKIMNETRFLDSSHYNWKLREDVHIWKFPVKSFELSLLSSSECQTAERFRFDEDKNRYSVGKQALRLLLSKYLSISPEGISIYSQSGGKPFISNPISSIQFNISHSGYFVLLAMANDAVGIDIEKMDPGFKFEKLLEDHFSDAEQSFIIRSDSSIDSFYLLWTRKEALVKAWGTGMQEDLKMISVVDCNSNFFEKLGKSWKLESLYISADYVAAVAFSGKLKNTFYFDGSELLL